MKETVKNASDKGIGYIQSDGSLIFQPYPKLLEEAKNMLGGLRQAGLKQGDVLVLAPSCNEEFIPAFWGCILGGIIPAPLPSPVNLFTPSPALERLHNVWNVLQQPYILLSENLRDQEPGKLKAALSIPKNKIIEFTAIQKYSQETEIYTSQIGRAHV